MSIFGTVCEMLGVITNQADEHVMTWALEDHAECVERSSKANKRLQALQKSGAKLNMRDAYNYGFGLKTEEPKPAKASKPVKKARKIKTPKKVEETAQN